MNITFFMGAHSKDGFFSLFDRLLQEDPACRIYALKGGPGCGKSSAIGKIAAAFAWPGEPVEYIACASDPQSLDGALLGGRGLALLDGTAPHVIDPALPGAAGGYLTLPPFVDLMGLEAKRPALQVLSMAAHAHYAQAYRLISAAWRIDEATRATLGPLMPAHKLARRAEGIIARELPKTGGPGRLMLRFLDGMTAQGRITQWQTVEALAGRVYVLEDSHGLAGGMLEALRDAALARGHAVYACLCPQNPQRLRHLILPGLSLAFVTADAAAPCPLKAYRRVRVDAYLEGEGLRRVQGKVKLMRRITGSLMDDAAAELASARLLHDEIEALYRPHIDFPALDRTVAEHIDTIARGACGR